MAWRLFVMGKGRSEAIADIHLEWESALYVAAERIEAMPY